MYVHWNDVVSERQTTVIVEAEKDKYCGLRRLTGRADSGVPPKPLFVSNMSNELAN